MISTTGELEREVSMQKYMQNNKLNEIIVTEPSSIYTTDRVHSMVSKDLPP